jgi:plastocyanin
MKLLGNRWVMVLGCVLSVVVGAAGCGVGGGHNAPSAAQPPISSATSSSGPGSSTGTAVLTIRDFAYAVPPRVSPGQKVSVRNADAVAHTVTADAGKSLFDVAVPPSGSVTFTAPAKPGRYPLHCTYHANMHATLVVR